METANDTAMHVPETKTLRSSLTCPKTKCEDITKKTEEELLYGNSEDGDEEDALSDDSIRLRVSDDEADLDERSPPESVSNDKTEAGSTNMERGSDVTANDISDRKSALRRENLTNGKSRVAEEDQASRADFTSGALSSTGGADGSNGDREVTENKRSFFLNGLAARRLAKKNFMMDLYRRSHRNAQSRPPHSQSNRYATNSYNNRYYNRNSHYGGGKGSGRGSSTNPREFGVKSEDSRTETADQGDTDVSQNRKIKTEEADDDRADVAGSSDTDANRIGQSQVKDPIDNRETEMEDSKELLKNRESDVNSEEFLSNDNAEAAPSSLDSSNEPTRKDSIGGGIVKDESNQADEKSGEVDDCNVSVASDETLIADDANDVAGNFSDGEKRKSSTEVEPMPFKKEPESSTNQLDNCETQEADECAEDLGNEDKDIRTEESDERPAPEKLGDVMMSNEDMGNTTMTNEAVAGTKAAADHTEQIVRAQQRKINDKEIVEQSSSHPLQRQKLEASSDHQRSTGVVESEPEIAAKQLSDVVSQHGVEESSTVATKVSETVERRVEAVDGETAPECKTSLIEDSIADLPDEKESSTDEDNDVSNVTVHSSLKRMSTEHLDEMELSKRMRIQRKKTNDSSQFGPSKDNDPVDLSPSEINPIDEETSKDNGSVVNPVTSRVADTKSLLKVETVAVSNTVVETSASGPKAEQEKSIERESVDDDDRDDKEKIDDCVLIEVPVKRKHKRVRRSLQNLQDTVVSQEDTQEKENGRQKRRTARNAEQLMRKSLDNCDTDSNDSAEKFVAVNYNKNSNDLRAASPPSLKRNHVEEEEPKVEPKFVKKLKQDLEVNGDVPKVESVSRDDKVQTLRHVRQFFRRENNGVLAKLKQEELEELLIQKVVETITMRDEIGKLREQAKVSERNQEATRVRCQQLSKQIKDFEMVLNRYHSDRRSNPDKTVVPIKINRSVGLQVNFVTDHGIQNLRQLGQAQKTAPPIVNGVNNTPPQRLEQSLNPNSVVKRTVKIRSPRRPDLAAPAVPVAAPSPANSQPIISKITPAALVVAKSVQDTRPSVTTTVQQTSISQLMTSNQTILVNGLTNPPVRQTTIQMSKAKTNSDLIDLTQEEEKIKTTMIPQNAILTTALADTSSSVTNVSNIQQRYHTVIQTIPGSVAITAPSGIRVVQPSSQPTPTALVNNMNAPRLAYVMQGGIGGPRQVVITSAPTPIRPAPDHQNRPIRAAFPLSGTITNGTVRVIPTSTTATLQVCKHPAALPEPINPLSNPSWKLPPPAPSLKISKVANGIVLSWNMALSDKFADIASYQLYAYQEVSGVPPSSTLWKKVGDVRALPLPMACTLTQFSEGNNYYFAVRAVDRYSRLGQYSQPGNISL